MKEEQTCCAQRAVILADEPYEQLRPVTYQTPAALIRVHGRQMLNVLIQILHQNGIQEVYVVVGHLKEQFAGLAAEYPGVTLIENPYYESAASIASLYCARDHLENSIILGGNLIVYDPAVLTPGFDSSGFSAVWTEETDCTAAGWQSAGISRWSAEDGRKLRRHLEIEFEEKQNRQIPWENIPLLRAGDYTMGIQKLCPDDVIAISTLEELADIDTGYAGLVKQKRQNMTV